MTYKFVTQKDLFKEPLQPWSPDLVMVVVNRLLAERDAFRSMLRGHFKKQREVSKEEFEKVSGLPTEFPGMDKYTLWETDWDAIDAEATRLMEKPPRRIGAEDLNEEDAMEKK